MSSITENNNTFFLPKKFISDVSERELFLHEKRFPFVPSETSNNNSQLDRDENINHVWTKDNFSKRNSTNEISTMKTNIAKTWAAEKSEIKEDGIEDVEEKIEIKEKESSTPTSEKESTSPSHHARRPMNAFLIFCKKHRPIVRQKFPNLENRGITRILGEWWAMLDVSDKSAYTNLAKEYKDAFFSANPDFKWYKLPAPPLRTLSTRPTILPTKMSSPVSTPTQITSSSADFTPGKLADESQLGSLTSLLSPTNSNSIKPDSSMDTTKTKILVQTTTSIESNSFTLNDEIKVTNITNIPMNIPESNIKTNTSVPPKPIKKRIYDHFNNIDNKSVVRDIFDTKSNAYSNDDGSHKFSKIAKLDQDGNSNMNSSSVSFENSRNGSSNNVTNQDLVNKVVDSIFSQNDITPKDNLDDEKQKSKELRKSIRSCKGRRYAEFMVEGKLLGNKHNKKITQGKIKTLKFENSSNEPRSSFLHNRSVKQTFFDLEDTIKRLQERTNKKLYSKPESKEKEKVEEERSQNSQSENSDEGNSRTQSYFDLDLRIAELPSLSYDAFLQRKRANKKRKLIRHKTEENELKTKELVITKNESSSLVGSKKRKNKNSIIRLENPSDHAVIGQFNNDLSGLATLAEIAANTEKIN